MDDAKREHERMLWRERQRRKRRRETGGETFYRVSVHPLVIEALIVKHVAGGMSEQDAERAVLNRHRVAADLARIGLQLARDYLKRDRA